MCVCLYILEKLLKYYIFVTSRKVSYAIQRYSKFMYTFKFFNRKKRRETETVFNSRVSCFQVLNDRYFQSSERHWEENYAGKMKTVWIIGGPGCGKGTQCDRMIEKYGFLHLSSGDLLRAEVASGSERGASLQDLMSKGLFVPTV